MVVPNLSGLWPQFKIKQYLLVIPRHRSKLWPVIFPSHTFFDSKEFYRPEKVKWFIKKKKKKVKMSDQKKKNSVTDVGNHCSCQPTFYFRCCSFLVFVLLCRRWNLPGHLPGLHPHGLQWPGQAEPLPAVRPAATLTLHEHCLLALKKMPSQLNPRETR